ncbi:Uncharacterised protein [Acinetobacter baumannii]|nr:Uncharacterised protein [Acinetobacter baumannii]
MNSRITTHNNVITNMYMSSDTYIISKDIMVTYDTIMCNMCIYH